MQDHTQFFSKRRFLRLFLVEKLPRIRIRFEAIAQSKSSLHTTYKQTCIHTDSDHKLNFLQDPMPPAVT